MLRTITQRELRNSSAAVMDAVEAGETIIVTRNGSPVAELRPTYRRKSVATAELMRSFRGTARPNYAAMRAEADRLFGEDRVGD